MIMANITPHIEMKTKVIYSFKSEIYGGTGEVVDYSKTLTSPPDLFTSLEEIQAYLKECLKTVRFEEWRLMLNELFTRHKSN